MTFSGMKYGSLLLGYSLYLGQLDPISERAMGISIGTLAAYGANHY